MSEKCICGHSLNDPMRGPIEKISTSFLHKNPVENRINCKYCECPKFKKKYFWSGRKNFPLKDD